MTCASPKCVNSPNYPRNAVTTAEGKSIGRLLGSWDGKTANKSTKTQAMVPTMAELDRPTSMFIRPK